MTDVVKGLELLFDRPNEPIITPKGDDQVLFKLNDQLLPKDYESNGITLNNRFGDDPDVKSVVVLERLKVKPEFRVASQLPRDADFSLFLPKHQEMADEVITALMRVPKNELKQLLSTCAYARGQLNPQLYHYCAAVAFLHRPDTKGVKIPNFAETFPAKFVNSAVVGEARQNSSVVPNGVNRPIIIINRDYTASHLEEEHRLAYFREDIGINLHHWHWHLVYPFRATHDRTIVAKDRRGELFYYMHQQIIARYNCERLNNALKRVKKFSNFREPIPEAYYPKLDSLTSSRGWPPRQANMSWQDVNRPVDGVQVTVSDMEAWREEIEEAIATGEVILPDGKKQPLTIDTLGNMIEASALSPNPDRYGSLHNNGHSFTAFVHDPNRHYLESFSVMADEATTMRDPYFYRWHAFIDDIFQKHKESSHVPKYQPSELEYPGVRVNSISIEPNTPGGRSNELNTFWMRSDVDLSRGLDFSNRGPVYARFTHINHRAFRYVINVDNSQGARRTTVRIFMAPKFDEGNRPWLLSDQRKMFIEMDKFVYDLVPGYNEIIRQSTDSSVTIPFEQTFRDLSRQGTDPGNPDNLEFNFCGCGWPQHMLVPRGNEAGAQYVLFVMLSNYEQDRVEQANVKRELTCKEASSFCGLRGRLYPDKRAMGFPFDRPSTTAANIDDFRTPNMAVRDIIIRYRDETEDNPRNPRKQ